MFVFGVDLEQLFLYNVFQKGGLIDEWILKKAIESNEVIEIIYQNNKGEISQRRIQVIKVNEEFFSVYWFTSKQQRTFKFSNILSMGPTQKVRRCA